MDDGSSFHSVRLSRRAAVAAGFGAIASAVGTGVAVAAEHPSLVYMREVAKDLLAANRQGTVASFLRAIQRHADVPEIALYSLGQYKASLASAQRDLYYRGVATFMSRYFADQSREYRVAKYELGEVRSDAKDVLISSKVFLITGATYSVTWRLSPRGKGYKVTDAKVLGFSLVYMQRGLFTSFLSKRNGDIGQLVAALNRP
ncbi:MAG: ABC transporter substrate-binding protein [Rhizobiales bacterium]|nr:ABC transporter substrate-binding protein [Hyphomicrobiales bacterium]